MMMYPELPLDTSPCCVCWVDRGNEHNNDKILLGFPSLSQTFCALELVLCNQGLCLPESVVWKHAWWELTSAPVVPKSWSFQSFLAFSHSLAINLSLECFLVEKSACCNVVISNLVCVRHSLQAQNAATCGLHNPEVHICASYWCWFVLQCPSWRWHKVVAFVLSLFLYMHSSLDIPCVSQVSSLMLQSVGIFQQHCC